ncbi:hypothetical protein [Nocardia yamanashiensis]|uniref:hypothetical protein n=1 Tax=Nocardia yamanashiensis TaxID=209247 RepID=UPI000AC334A7|nr:hypothetical protein [Nocardia yamanashiensis]
MGRHPKRTPFYGVLMLLTVMITGLWVRDLTVTWLRITLFIVLFAVALVGFVMTFRDYS